MEQLESAGRSGSVPGCSTHAPVDGGSLCDEPVMVVGELGD
jgi:hypothetical protein